MVKGAVLVGCGFIPTAGDIRGAIRQGYIKNCDTISALGFTSVVSIERVLTIYASIARAKGWADPSGLQALQFSASGGQPIWSVYPMG